MSLEGVVETWGARGGCGSEVRALAFSVFTGARRLLAHSPNGKSLTGFGTAANANLFLSSKDVSVFTPLSIYTHESACLNVYIHERVFQDPVLLGFLDPVP